MTRILSGVQATGNLTYGNYLGAIRRWLDWQQQGECLFAIMDLHALTNLPEGASLRDICRDMLALYMACGLDPEQSALFVQSHVPAHSELAWILNCFTPVGDLQRMTQYKSKSERQKHNLNAGLLTYPTLMAADILLYQATHVPVGDDQKQHLELTRDIAIRFNNRFGDTFVVPEPHIDPHAARIMGLQDPTVKMSKSDESPTNVIFLLDDTAVTAKRIMRAVTDMDTKICVDPNRPGISNLVNLFAATRQVEPAVIEQEYEGAGYGQFKKDLAACIVATIEPIQARYAELVANPDYLDAIALKGASQASTIANKTLRLVQDKLNLLPHA